MTSDMQSFGMPAARAHVTERAAFIAKTYAHLAGAVGLFTLIEVYLFTSGMAASIANAMLGTSWLLVLGAFMVVSWVATHVAHSSISRPLQYAALVGYVFAQALIFVPLLAMAFQYAPGAVSSAASVTLLGFAILTAIVFYTRKDFSFLRTGLMWGGGLAFVAIIAGVIFGFQLGTWFSVAMVGFAGAAILYDTSNVLNQYPVDRHVGAALQLFASVALMFWYVLRIFIGSRN
jgi:FtsH-binding integral membrane protein